MEISGPHTAPTLSETDVKRLVLSLGLPAPSSVKPMRVTAQYHSIYILSYDIEHLSHLTPAKTTDLILRVSGDDIPHFKTMNEVAVMTWVRQKTSIPVPAVVRFDSTKSNIIGHEFTLLECANGCSIEKLYASLGKTGKQRLVEQITDFVLQLYSHEWHHVGGLALDETGNAISGPYLDENFWQAKDIERYWGAEESVSSLNVRGPFTSWTEYACAALDKYKYMIERHPSLEIMRDALPTIDEFSREVAAAGEDVNNVRYMLDHRDLHFGNIMCDPDTLQITAVLDWEFACVVPAPMFNTPNDALLWNASEDASSKSEQRRLLDVFDKTCFERGSSFQDDTKPNEAQEDMQDALNYLRAICEVCPRGQKAEAIPKWRAAMETAMEDFAD